MTPAAANDNGPRSFTEGQLAERRAWLDSLPQKHKPVLAWPTAERLSRLENPEAAKSLFEYSQLMSPAHMVVANDNDPEFAATEADPDMIHEMRPSPNELLRAASDGLRCRVVSSKESGKWRVTSRCSIRRKRRWIPLGQHTFGLVQSCHTEPLKREQ